MSQRASASMWPASSLFVIAGCRPCVNIIDLTPSRPFPIKVRADIKGLVDRLPLVMVKRVLDVWI